MTKARAERPLKSGALTVRLIPEDLERLRKLAEELGVGPAVLARILIRQGLKSLSSTSQARFPLKELSALLAPAAQAQGLSEEELLEEVKAVRRELYEERYASSGKGERASQSQSQSQT